MLNIYDKFKIEFSNFQFSTWKLFLETKHLRKKKLPSKNQSTVFRWTTIQPRRSYETNLESSLLYIIHCYHDYWSNINVAIKIILKKLRVKKHLIKKLYLEKKKLAKTSIGLISAAEISRKPS